MYTYICFKILNENVLYGRNKIINYVYIHFVERIYLKRVLGERPPEH